MEYELYNTNMIELWASVIGYDGLYEVSNLGRVRSVPSTTRTWSRWKNYPGKVLEQSMGGSGYYQVTLCRCGHEKTAQVHRIMAESFYGLPSGNMQVCHFDGNKTNNTLDNLRFDTPSGNANDRVRHGTMPSGDNHPRIKLTSIVWSELASFSGSMQDAVTKFGICEKSLRMALKKLGHLKKRNDRAVTWIPKHD